MADRIRHECGQPMERGTRLVPFTYMGHTLTLEQPGWYCACGEGIHAPEDCEVTDDALERFRERVDGTFRPPSDIVAE